MGTATRWPAAAAVAVAGLLTGLTACSSGPGLAAREQASRAPVLPAAEQLRAQLATAGVSWTAEILGGFEECGSDDPVAVGRGDGEVQYSAVTLMTPYNHTVTYATFARQLVEAVSAAGWKLRQGNGSDPETQARYYVGQRGGTDLWLVELDAHPGLGIEADVHLSGSCLDAGSAEESLLVKGASDQVEEPRPTSTPTPEYP